MGSWQSVKGRVAVFGRIFLDGNRGSSFLLEHGGSRPGVFLFILSRLWFISNGFPSPCLRPLHVLVASGSCEPGECRAASLLAPVPQSGLDDHTASEARFSQSPMRVPA